MPQENVGNVVLLGVVRDKPINQPQGNIRRALEQFHDLLLVIALRIEALKTAYNEFLLAMNLPLTGLWIWLNANDGMICQAIHTSLNVHE